ncbi:crotonase/enoyl-CoA hydratase family protein [Thermaurantiacus sp.]
MAVETETHGAVLVVTIARAEKRNAVDPATAAALRTAFERFASDAGLAVAILTGAGGQFCAGFDLGAVAEAAHDPSGPGPMGPTRMLLAKPVIAAVEGHAVAGGLELALWCDLRVASETAVFGVFCRRFGVPLIDGGTVRLPRLVGEGRALDMILTGRPVAAAEAHRWGLVDRLVPEGKALAQALELAQGIARFPQTCLRADRWSARTQWGRSLGEALQVEALGGEAPLGAEARAGAARFLSGAGRHGRID